MRNQPKALVAIAAALLTQATAARAVESVCKTRCEGGRKEVGVLIESMENLVGDTYTDNWSYEAAPKTFVPPKGVPMSAIHFVDNASAIRSVFEAHERKCEKIKYLALDGHGGLGSPVIGTEINVTNVADRLGGLDCMMADDAVIEIGGCNVGRGCRGEDFLGAAASVLLKGHGGSISAYTNYSVTAFGSKYHSINGDSQVITVDKDLNITDWDNDPQSGRQCANRADDAAKAMGRMVEMGKRCVSAARLARMQMVQGDLERAAEMQRILYEREGPRIQLKGNDFSYAKLFYESFEVWGFYQKYYIDLLYRCRDSDIAEMPKPLSGTPSVRPAK